MQKDDNRRQPSSTQVSAPAALLRLMANREPTVVRTEPGILVVDDDPLQAQGVKGVLGTAGYHCETAFGGGEALERLRQGGFELLLLDLRMPEIDGFEVMRELRAEHLDVSVVILSGDTTWENASLALRQGAEDLLRKPYGPEQLIGAVARVLEGRRLRAHNAQMSALLELSERLHRFLVDRSPDLIFILDRKLRFQFVNEGFERLLGFSRQDLIGRDFRTLLMQEDRLPAPGTHEWLDHLGHLQDMEAQLRRNPANPAGAREPFFINVELTTAPIHDDEIPVPDLPDTPAIYGIARDITKRKEAEALVKYQAYHDLLTGLPNRALFNDRLDRAITQARRNGTSFAVMFLDLDRFKLVNDTLGHSLGDRLLQEVANRIRRSIREADTLSRIGGDEFMLLLPQIAHPQDATLIADKIQQALHTPFVLDGHELFVRASMGIAIFPEHGESADLLMKRADMAMYEIKNHGRDAYGFYSSSLDQTYATKLSIEHGLRKALELEQFEVFYQPLVRLSDRRVRSMEALLRWHHPERGLLRPDTFIQEAEESGLILEIGGWVLRQVMADLRRWLDQGVEPVPIAVNVSAIQLEYPGFVTQFKALMHEFRIPARLLHLELTENILMTSMHLVVSKLQALSELGVSIAIDDFGTGYSSLSRLKTLPIHTLKVDRSFLTDIEGPGTGDNIVGAIASMARGLHLDLVAEGIEREVQASYLKDIGCECGQGFLFHRPLPADQAIRLIA